MELFEAALVDQQECVGAREIGSGGHRAAERWQRDRNTLGAFVGFLLCIIPGIAWIIFTAYAPILALDKGMGPGEAISTSINWVKDNFGTVFVILLVAYGFPALVLGFATREAWWGFPLALLAWAAFPAALLNLDAFIMKP